MIIKICGIRTEEDAEFCIKQGANWVGIMHYQNSIRYVDLKQAKKIAEATRKAQGEPVAVFVNSSAEEILKWCQVTGITYVQLHGPLPRQEHHLLPSYFTRIYVRHVNADGVCLEDIDQGQHYLEWERDYILFDNVEGGSGKYHHWTALPINPNMRFLVAGGLKPSNIECVLLQLKPHGVDVSSGVESISGIKSQKLIADFIANILHVS